MPGNWFAAEDACMTLGSHLVSIHSQDENIFVHGESISSIVNRFSIVRNALNYPSLEIASAHGFLTDTGYSLIWIGFIDRSGQSSHQFRWTDNSVFDYTNYYTSYFPNPDPNYKCGFMYTDHVTTSVNSLWGNNPCERSDFRAFVCKRPAAH